MVPVYVARGLADGRHRELLAGAKRRRLMAAVPAGPGAVQRFALRVAGGGPAAGRPGAEGIRAAGDLIGS
jgi:hypothetical protein